MVVLILQKSFIFSAQFEFLTKKLAGLKPVKTSQTSLRRVRVESCTVLKVIVVAHKVLKFRVIF